MRQLSALKIKKEGTDILSIFDSSRNCIDINKSLSCPPLSTSGQKKTILIMPQPQTNWGRLYEPFNLAPFEAFHSNT